MIQQQLARFVHLRRRQSFLDAFRAADGGAGVACLYGNYSGDNMNVKMAVRMAKKEGLNVKTVVANDDVASAPKNQREKRRRCCRRNSNVGNVVS